MPSTLASSKVHKPQTIRLLVVEDNEAYLYLIQRAFSSRESIHWELTVAHDGEQAMKLLFEEEKTDTPLPDLILTDWNLPRISGSELLQRLKKHEKLRKILVLVFSSSEADRDVHAAYDNHANGYITKPDSVEVLAQIVETIVLLDCCRQTSQSPPLKKACFTVSQRTRCGTSSCRFGSWHNNDRYEMNDHSQTEALRNERGPLPAVFAAADLGFWTWDVQADNLVGDPRIAFLFGIDETIAAAGTSADLYIERVEPHDRVRMRKELGKVLVEGGNYRLEYRVRGTDGELRWVASRGRVELDSNNHPKSLIGIVQDITDQKINEKKMRDSEELLRLASEAAELGLWVWHIAEDRVTWENDKLYKIYARDPKAGPVNAAQFLAEIVHPDDANAFMKAIAATIEMSERFYFLGRIRKGDGSQGWVEFTGQLNRSLNGEPESIVGTAADVTERKEAEQILANRSAELARSNDDLQQFAHVASHDLRSPTNTILQFTELIMRRSSLDDSTKELLVIVRDSAKRMDDLVSALLDYSRLNNAEKQQPTPVSSLDAYKDAVVNLTFAIKEADAELEHEDLPYVFSSPIHLTQVFQNLIYNAIHYRSQQAPRIKISAERRDDFWLFSVADNGPGIAPQYHKMIFEPFKRLHGAERPGSGIGLAFCRKFIERDGGQIWVESEEGGGAQFHFTLPAVHNPQ